MILRLGKKYQNFIVYSLIGCTGTLIDLIIFILLTQIGIPYLLANVFSISVGITNNFLLNAFFNFKVKDDLLKRFSRFYGIGLIGLLISSILLFVLIDFFSVSKIIAKLSTVFVVVLIQYNLNKIITFRVIKE
ncbi:MAG: GtrA family protein [Candidatus Margulisiibacteriota bacterium]|jgi:putative flippase GtrA